MIVSFQFFATTLYCMKWSVIARPIRFKSSFQSNPIPSVSAPIDQKIIPGSYSRRLKFIVHSEPHKEFIIFLPLTQTDLGCYTTEITASAKRVDGILGTSRRQSPVPRQESTKNEIFRKDMEDLGANGSWSGNTSHSCSHLVQIRQ